MKENKNQLVFLKDLRDRSERAYRQLYEIGHKASMKFIQARGGSREDAEDLFQEALVIFSAKIEQPDFTLKKEATVEGFLMGIVKICWRRWCEKKGKEANTVKEPPPSSMITLLPSDSEERFLEQQLKKALEKLSGHCKKVLLDFYFGRFSLKDIAAEMDYTTSFIKVKKHRCIQELRSLMSKNKTLS